MFAFTRQLKVKLKLQPGGAINVNAPWVLWASGRGDDEGEGAPVRGAGRRVRSGKYADADWRKNAEIEDAMHWMLA